MVVILVSLSLPAHIVEATNGTTVEVNSGNMIIIHAGESQSDIPLDIKGMPDLGPDSGLGAFGFILTWDNAVINVTSVTAAPAPPGYTFMLGLIEADTTTIGGYASLPPYVSGDLTIAYLTITAVGSAGESTSINVTIEELIDVVAGDPIIPATSVNAHVSISLAELVSIAVTPAVPSIALGETQQFTATGTYTLGTADITDIVTWAGHNPSVATIDAAGLATSLAAGTTAIIATLYAIDGTTTLTVTEAETEEVVASPTEAEPGITDVSDSADDEDSVFTEEATVESEDDKAELAIDEGTGTVKVLPPKPINWWVWLIVGLAVVAVIGVVSWLILRRRTA